jgi:hypothetical protein
MDLIEEIFGATVAEDEDELLAHRDGSCRCHEFFWLKNIAAEAETIDEVVNSVSAFLGWLRARRDEGFELQQPVHDGHGYLLRSSGAV